MIDDPIDKLIKMAPTPAVLIATPKPNQAGGAQTSNSSLDVAAAAQTFPGIVGAFSNAVDAALDGSASAIFTIRAADMPAIALNADFARCKVNGVDYLIDKVRDRFWMGVLNGHTFALTL